MKKLEQKLIEITHAHDEVLLKKAKVEEELSTFKGYVFGMHQATFLYGMLTTEKQFDIGKDAFQEQLVPVEDFPVNDVATKESPLGEEVETKDGEENVK